MSATLPFPTHTVKRSVIGMLSLLAIVPLLYFAACSSGDDNGGGASSPPPGGGSSAIQNAYVIAGDTEIQAYKLDNDGNLTAVVHRLRLEPILTM